MIKTRLSFLTCCVSALVTSAVLAGEIALTVTEPSDVQRTGWPVTSGIPLAPGELRSDRQTALFDNNEVEVPLQTEILSRWPDGSIRWLLLDFQVDLAANQSQKFSLHYGADIERSEVPNPVDVGTRLDIPSVTTGPLQVDLSPHNFRFLDAVWVDSNGDGQFADDERVTRGEGSGIVLTTPDGERFRADLAQANMTFEQFGPLRACVRIEGNHQAENGDKMFRYVIRLHAFRGQPFLKIDYTFINDDQNSIMTSIDSIEVVFETGTEGGEQMVLEAKVVTPSLLYQVDDQKYEVNGMKAGRRAPGWAAIGTSTGGLAVGVREFWQNWPKSLQVAPGELTVGLCPDFKPGFYDGRSLLEETKHTYYLRDGVYTLKIGVARTHQMWATFFAGNPPIDELTNFFRATEKPLLARCSPNYIVETGVLGQCPPADPKKYYRYDAWLDSMFQQHLIDQETVRENGMLNFGDWWHLEKFGGGWGNQEYDTSHNFMQQYLRSGDRRYFDRARQGAMHLMDVDICHATNRHLHKIDESARAQPGQIWTHSVGHTGGYYDGAPLEIRDGLQRGHLQDTGHVWVGGLCDTYLLTGNRRMLDVAKLAADRVASECPTRYSDHIRGIAWPLNLLITAYETTGEERYLAAAHRQWDTLRANLDQKQGWVIMLAYGHCTAKSTGQRCRGQNSYMLALMLSTLARYHQITGDPEVLEGLTIGLDQMIRESWDEQHKTFYPTSCVHQRDKPPAAYCPTAFLSSLAFAHEIARTGNKEHLRIYRLALKTALTEGADQQTQSGGQAGYASRAFHFTPHGLRLLEDEK